jgi:hypothetical protein
MCRLVDPRLNFYGVAELRIIDAASKTRALSLASPERNEARGPQSQASGILQQFTVIYWRCILTQGIMHPIENGRDFPFGGECLHHNQDNPVNGHELREEPDRGTAVGVNQ